jgi:hypothetical protein
MSSRIALIALVCVGATGLAVAQTTSPQDTTPPNSSHQSAPKEAPTTSSNASSPSSASSPHQRQAMSKEPTAQQMKDCVAKQRAENSSMSSSEAKKACKEEFKAHSPTSH